MGNEQIFEVRIEDLRKLHEVWSSENPVLRYGERVTAIMPDGYVRHKTGDGVAAYNSLSFDEDECLAKVFLASPTAAESNSLSSHGYYYAYATISGVNYSFGVFYWDGSTTTYVNGDKGYWLLVNNFGIIFLYDSNSITPIHTLYVAKL